MWEVIGFILTAIFWIIVWANVAAVRKSLRSIERSAAILAGQVAPTTQPAPAVLTPAPPLPPQSSWRAMAIGLGIAVLLVVLDAVLASRTP